MIIFLIKYYFPTLHDPDLIEACVLAIEQLTANGYKLNEQ